MISISRRLRPRSSFKGSGPLSTSISILRRQARRSQISRVSMETSSATTRERHPYRGYWPVRSNREILESPVFRGQNVRSPEQYHVRPPERVYDELTVNDSDVDTLPIDTAINEGWARVSEPLKYTNALVSRTMDGVQRYIANADDRPADDIERADPALAGVAAQAFVEGRADQAYIYTT